MSDRVLTILAGGTSRRFQHKNNQWSDKALMNYIDKPLLIHLLVQSIKLYDSVAISINKRKRKKVYSNLINLYSTLSSPHYIIDEKRSRFEGVLKGIYTSMKYFENKEIQFVPSDRPYLNFEIIRKLDVKDNGASILQYSNGMIEPLLSLYGKNMRIPPIFFNLSLSRADVPIRLAQSIQTFSIEKLLSMNNLSARILANINVKVDLDIPDNGIGVPKEVLLPIPRHIERKPLPPLPLDNMKRKIYVVMSELMERERFYAAYLWVLLAQKNRWVDEINFNKLARDALRREMKYWNENNISFLELHALQDLVHNFPEEQTKNNMSTVLKLKERMRIKPRKIN